MGLDCRAIPEADVPQSRPGARRVATRGAHFTVRGGSFRRLTTVNLQPLAFLYATPRGPHVDRRRAAACGRPREGQPVRRAADLYEVRWSMACARSAPGGGGAVQAAGRGD